MTIEAKLVVVGGNATKGEVNLKLPMTIGRTKDAGLSIAHPMVSRLHCTLYEMEGAVVIRDNNSSNGTFVNDQRISESVLRPGDKLTVGPLTFVAIYKHPGRFPQIGPRPAPPPQPGAAQPSSGDSDADLNALAAAAQNLDYNNEDPTTFHPSHGTRAGFQDLINEIPDADFEIDSGDNLFGSSSIPRFDEGDDVLDIPEEGDLEDFDHEDYVEEDEEEEGTVGGESPDVNSFFQDLLDMAAEDSLLDFSADGKSDQEPEVDPSEEEQHNEQSN